jgi:hypothetical protein
VGTVLRHTVGYQNQFGGRRSQAPLSFSYLQKFADIASRPALNRALQHALETGYILRVHEGVVDPRSALRKPAVYAVKWQTQATEIRSSSKRQPVQSDQFKSRCPFFISFSAA